MIGQPDPCGASCEPAEDAAAEARSQDVTEDREMLRRPLSWMTDHGGGSGPFPECRLDTCPSCQARHLLNSRVVAW